MAGLTFHAKARHIESYIRGGVPRCYSSEAFMITPVQAYSTLPFVTGPEARMP